MAASANKVEPDLQSFTLRWGLIHVEHGRVQLEVGWALDGVTPITVTIDPENAPLFRMIANRLDEIAGKRKRRA